MAVKKVFLKAVRWACRKNAKRAVEMADFSVSVLVEN